MKKGPAVKLDRFKRITEDIEFQAKFIFIGLSSDDNTDENPI